MRVMTTTTWRAIRASVGAVLLVIPAGALGRIAGRNGEDVTMLASVLGIRHLVQAAVTNTPSRLKAGAAVDGLHLATLALTAVKVGAGGAPHSPTAPWKPCCSPAPSPRSFCRSAANGRTRPVAAQLDRRASTTSPSSFADPLQIWPSASVRLGGGRHDCFHCGPVTACQPKARVQTRAGAPRSCEPNSPSSGTRSSPTVACSSLAVPPAPRGA